MPKLLTEHHLEILGLKGGCTDSSESTLFKIPHCWKSHVAAQMCENVLISSGRRMKMIWTGLSVQKVKMVEVWRIIQLVLISYRKVSYYS